MTSSEPEDTRALEYTNDDFECTQSHSDSDSVVQMIGSLPPWKGISAYCKALFEGIDQQWGRLKFTGWSSLYPKRLYPGGDPKTNEQPVEGDQVERPLSWYNPISWLRVGLDPDIELIHAQWWSYPLAVPYIVIFLASKLRKKTILLTVHNVAPHEQTILTTFLNNTVYRFADQYIVHSERNRSQLISETRINPDDVHIIHHPTVGPEKQGISQSTARRDLGLKDDADVVLFFGSIREYKGLKSLLKLIADLNGDHELELLIAGKSWVDWDQYEALIREYGLSEYVHRYPGYIPEDSLETFFTAADVVAFPYEHFDAQSGVAELARHFQTCSVGYDVGGLVDQVDLVATNPTDFKEGLLAAIDGEITQTERDDDAVHRHISLYKYLLTTSDPDESFPKDWN